jgi:hypothetical protein
VIDRLGERSHAMMLELAYKHPRTGKRTTVKQAVRIARQQQPAGIVLLIALLLGGCLGRPLPPSTARPQAMCHAPGGGYVACDLGYHGSGGP